MFDDTMTIQVSLDNGYVIMMVLIYNEVISN